MIGIFCKHCKNIIYSRANHDYRKCDCGKCSIDGIMMVRVGGKEEDYIELDIDKDVLLRFIMWSDWNLSNNNAKDYPEGYLGKFIINEKSNPKFYEDLIVNFNEIEGEFVWKS